VHPHATYIRLINCFGTSSTAYPAAYLTRRSSSLYLLHPYDDTWYHSTILPTSFKHLELTSIDSRDLGHACSYNNRSGRSRTQDNAQLWQFLMDPVPAIGLETFTVELIMHFETVKGLRQSWVLREQTLKRLKDAANALIRRGFTYRVCRRDTIRDERGDC
jgi:hypothetical protein